jgi:hypothetical protein
VEAGFRKKIMPLENNAHARRHTGAVMVNDGLTPASGSQHRVRHQRCERSAQGYRENHGIGGRSPTHRLINRSRTMIPAWFMVIERKFAHCLRLSGSHWGVPQAEHHR